MISVGGRFHIEGESTKTVTVLTKKLELWVTESLRVINSKNLKSGSVNEFIEFHNVDNTFSFEAKVGKLKVKDEIRVDVMAETDKLHSLVTPRLFLDNRNPRHNRLRIRAKSFNEGNEFLKDFLNSTKTKKKITSYPYKDLDYSPVTAELSWNERKLERALAKIAVNCLIHYLPDSKDQTAIMPALKYVRYDNSNISAALENKNNLIDNTPNTHNIFFYQLSDNFSIRISLFNGIFVFNIYIPTLKLLPEMNYKRLIIDFRNRKNNFQNEAEFLSSIYTK